jgi:BASS family bile acid:Na+ symporter
MKLTTFVLAVLKVSIILLVFSFGLDVTVQETTCLLRRAGLLLRSLLAMNVVMPLAAAALVLTFDIHPAVKVALVALSVSPVPPFMPKKGLAVGGSSSFTFSLLVAEALLAVVLIPVSIWLFAKAAAMPVRVAPATVALVVLATVLVPLAAGMLVRRIARRLAAKVAEPLSRLATVLLLLSMLPIFITGMPLMASLIGDGTLAAIAAFIVIGLGVGHALGGPQTDDRTVLALAASSRHPAVALAVALTNFPGQPLILAAILLYLIVNAVVSLPYLVWRRHSFTAQHCQN